MRKSCTDCNVHCPPLTRLFYSEDDDIHTCDYTEWAYTLFAVTGCVVVLAPVLLLICTVCKRTRRGSIGSRDSNSQYQVVSEEDIGSHSGYGEVGSYGTFSTDDQDTLVGSLDDDDSLQRLEDGNDSEDFEDIQRDMSSVPKTAATLGSPAVPYYVPLNYGKNIAAIDPELMGSNKKIDLLTGSPGSDSVEILPPEAESKFLDSLSTMTSSYHTAAGSMENLSQSLSDAENNDEQPMRVEDDEIKPRFESRADFENLLMMNVKQFPPEKRNGIFLLRDSVSLSNCKVLTMYAKGSSTDKDIYHFKINIMDDNRANLVNGLKTLPNLPSLIQYLRDAEDILPCCLTQEIHWDHRSPVVLTVA